MQWTQPSNTSWICFASVARITWEFVILSLRCSCVWERTRNATILSSGMPLLVKTHYDWGNMNLPFLDIKGADVFEPVDVFTRKYLALSQTVSVTLLKIRLLMDVRNLQNSTAMGEKLAQEVLDSIRGQLVSTIVAKYKDIVESKDQSTLVGKLESQVKKLYTAVRRQNYCRGAFIVAPHDCRQCRSS